MARELRMRHANVFHRVTQQQYDSVVARIATVLPNASASDIPVYLSMLTAAVGDAHTYVSLPGGQHFFPFGVYYFGSEPRVVRTIPAYRNILGTRLAKIGDLDLHQVESRLDDILTQGENTSFYRAHYPWFLSYEILHALGILTNPKNVHFTFARDDGTLIEVTIPTDSSAQHDWLHPYQEAPLYVQHENDDFWFTTLPGTNTVYVIFNSYSNLSENAAHLFDYIDHHVVDRLVIDLRGNSGGDYLMGYTYLVRPIVHRPSLNKRGALFVITGRYTFSAAMNNSAQFRTETRAILVGEPPGEMPNSYQERKSFRLPRSHLVVNYSSQYYRFLPQDVPALIPDVEIDPTWTAYQAGRDSVLEWIIANPVQLQRW
jgi:hypothetical protein